MTREDIISKVSTEINRLEEQKKEKNPLFELFNNFTNKYKGIDTSDFDTIDLYDFVVCFFLNMRSEFTIEEAKEVLLPVKQLLNIDDPNNITSLYESILKIVHFNEEDALKAFISKNMRKPRGIEFNTKMLVLLENEFVEVQTITSLYNLDNSMIIRLVDLIKRYGFEMWEIKRIIGDIKIISEFENLTKYPAIANDEEYQERIMGKLKPHIQYIYNQFDKIFKYAEKLKRKETSRIAKIDKKEQPLKGFLNDFGFATNTEITDYKEIISKIPEHLRFDALKLMYLHNEKVYSVIDEKHTELSKNKKLKYQSLLSSYDIKYISQTLLQIPYEDLNKSLQLLKKFGLDNNVIIYILENSSLSIIEEINVYLERGIINKKFIKNNYLILLPNIENSNLFKNIKLLENENINPNSFATSARILLIDNALFSNNIEILKKYNLLSSMKTTTNYNFLQDSNMVNIIDKLLELGMEKFLEENLGLLNHKNLDRLYILKALNIKIDTIEELMSYLNLRNFYVNDEDIFKYLHEGTISFSEDTGTVDLNSFQSTDRTIDINGVLFSKNKVQRHLKSNSINDTKEALFKNIKLTEEEIETVISALNDKKVYTYK